MDADHSLPENLHTVNNSIWYGSYHRKEGGKRWQTFTTRAQKCNCGSPWCPVCWPRSRSKREVTDRLRTFNWRAVRHVVLSTNPYSFENDPSRAWEEITFQRGVGNLLKNLERTEGIGIMDWVAFVEWYENGFPHWHVLIEVDKEGKAGMIGEQVIHRYWPKRFGLYIHEEPIKDLAHWANLVGYFDKHGYFDDGKGHQGRLPEWARVRNKVIKRYETKKLKWGLEGKGNKKISQVSQDVGVDVEAGERSQRRAYGLILEECGAKTRIVVECKSWRHSWIAEVPYQEIKTAWTWEYIEGKGLTQVLDEAGYTSFVARVLDMEDSHSENHTLPTHNVRQEGGERSEQAAPPLEAKQTLIGAGEV